MVFVFAIAGFNLRTDYTYNITTELENVYYSSKHESDPCFLFCFSTKEKVFFHWVNWNWNSEQKNAVDKMIFLWFRSIFRKASLKWKESFNLYSIGD